MESMNQFKCFYVMPKDRFSIEIQFLDISAMGHHRRVDSELMISFQMCVTGVQCQVEWKL